MDKETLEKLRRIYDKSDGLGRVLMEKEFPELRESENEKIRKGLLEYLNEREILENPTETKVKKEWISWLEKQKELKTIQWTGDNLKEVTKFTGLSPEFNNWFKSWDEYESYVHSHNDVFKLFFEDGSHYEVPKGAWIIRTPDGYNVASRSKYVEKQKSLPPTSSGAKYYFDEWFQQQLTPKYFDAFLAGIEFNKKEQKSAEWSDEDEKMLDEIIEDVMPVGECPDYPTEKEKEYFYKGQDKVDWLKSLKPQKYWKPSKEQMEAFEWCVKQYKDCHFKPNHETIESLYENLKKL